MKLRISNSRPGRRRSASSLKGFTLTEIMVAMAILLIVVSGILTAHLFGLRMYQLNVTKLTATEWSRSTFGKMADEVRSCNSVEVGNINATNGTFEGLLDNEAQLGTALLIYPTNSTTNSSFIVYFLNAADQTFRRTTDQPNSAVILADSITNTTVFAAQDFSGNVLTSSASSNSPVIHLTLEFYQPAKFQQDPQQYKLETSITRHALE